MRCRSRERGSTLLVGMIMLVLLTLIAVSAIESSTSSIQVVGNAQFRQEAAAAAQQAIENTISSSVFTIVNPAPQSIDVNDDGVSDYTVTFSPAPSCSKYSAVDTATEPNLPKDCYGSPGTTYCYRTTWDVTAAVNDITTGAKVTLHQGVKILVGINAALASCGV
ncbi:MAG TPA: pilus assembly PilX N-terminal domain-containing protein [Methylotenera sp.]|nr:pilus assembly PilX N-terminal domain-containing protein [Methylotenera sp.]